MMKAKILVLISALVLGLSGAAYGMPPTQAPDFERLATELQITEQQQDQFFAIMKAQHDERKALHQQGRDMMKDQMRAKMDELDQSVMAKLEALLTPEQMAEFSERVEKRKEAMKMRRMLSKSQGDCCPPSNR